MGDEQRQLDWSWWISEWCGSYKFIGRKISELWDGLKKQVEQRPRACASQNHQMQLSQQQNVFCENVEQQNEFLAVKLFTDASEMT